MLECVVNISEGRRQTTLERLRESVKANLLDFHADPTHNRSVFTLAGPHLQDAVRALAREAVDHLDISGHDGIHPRLGVVDVVPFVPLEQAQGLDEAIVARNAFGEWLGSLGVPCFAYGTGGRTLPDIRKRAFIDLEPTWGPPDPHETAGACCVGARRLLVAYNLWLADGPSTARALAKAIRGPDVRALGLNIDGQGQVSCNLIEPLVTSPEVIYDQVRSTADIDHAELVGLVPAAVLEAIPEARWPELGLDPSATIEQRLARLAGGEAGPQAEEP